MRTLRPGSLLLFGALACCIAFVQPSEAQRPRPQVLDAARLAENHFGADAPWYLANIPFLEIDDAEIERIYYYRWQVYRSHLREIGEQGTTETEFLTDVPWARQPYTDLDDSSSFHIMEGRWLRNPRWIDSLVGHLYSGAGDDRHFSESIAAATLAWTQVTGDVAPALRHLDSMRYVYNAWDDHFDASRGLYWIEPLQDATEYTIASIDASGAGFEQTASTDQDHNGFTQGYGFRPSINSYQYANAQAIAVFAEAAGQPVVAADYRQRAEALRRETLAQLWNPALRHFTDVYQRSTPWVKEGAMIRGRELVGFVPWMYGLPPRQSTRKSSAGQPDYNAAWSHALDPEQLGGAHGLRTVEPSYARYMRQYRYDAATGQRECQWNGPAWPFQISQVLTGMANLLQDPAQHAVTAANYVHLLRQYAHLHLDPAGKPDLQEDYDPDTGKVIVGLPRSHHYEHSTFNDLVLSGLLGVRPRSDDVLELHPLLPAAGFGERPIRYFALQALRYHGHDLTLIYDEDGKRYRRGAGLSVFDARRRVYGPAALKPVSLPLGKAPTDRPAATPRVDWAANVWEHAPTAGQQNLPVATASSTAPGTDPYQAIDGRLWFFPEIVNGWSPDPQHASEPAWIEVDLRRPQWLNEVELAFFAGKGSASDMTAPASVELLADRDGRWTRIARQRLDEAAPVAGGITHIRFPAGSYQGLRLAVHADKGATFRLIEWEAFGPG